MHPALSNQDILISILEFFYAVPLFNQQAPPTIMVDKKELFHASLVCTAFTSTALDILWRTLDSLRPLLKILINTDLEEIPDPAQAYCTIDHEKWARFQMYSQRVRNLCLEGNTLSETASAQLLERRRGLPLLPNLLGLSVALDSSTTYSEISLLLSPTIRTFQLQIPQAWDESAGINDEMRQLVDQLAPTLWKTFGIGLEILILEPEIPLYSFDPSLFKNLQVLFLTQMISNEDFSMISQMHNLTDLDIHLKAFSSEEHSFSSPAAGKLPRLRSLAIRDGFPQPVFSILQGIKSSSINHMIIGTASQTSTWWLNVSALLVEKWGHSLMTLMMIQTKDSMKTPRFFQASHRIPLLQSFGIAGTFIGEFQDFGFLAQSATNLLALTLAMFKASSWQLLPRIRRMFPSLLQFSTVIGMHNPVHLIIEEPVFPQSHPLEYLQLGSFGFGSQLSHEDQLDIARFINHNFPVVTVAVIPGGGGRLDESLYRDVQKHIVEIRKEVERLPEVQCLSAHEMRGEEPRTLVHII